MGQTTALSILKEILQSLSLQLFPLALLWNPKDGTFTYTFFYLKRPCSLLLFACENTRNWEYPLPKDIHCSTFAQKPPPDRRNSVLSSTSFQPTEQGDAQKQHLHEDISSGVHCSDSKLPGFHKTRPGNCCISDDSGNKGLKKVTASAPDLRSLLSSSLLPTGLVSPEYPHPAVVRESRYKDASLSLMNWLSHAVNSPT